MKYLMWLLKAAIFFTLFAFALNNQEDVTVRFFFGTVWRAPMVLVVLAARAGHRGAGHGAPLVEAPRRRAARTPGAGRAGRRRRKHGPSWNLT